MSDKNYLYPGHHLPEAIINISEALTIIFGGMLGLILIFGVFIFCFYSSKLDNLLKWALVSELLRTIITIFMGLFLYTDWADGVKVLVIIRPWVLLFACWAMGSLILHYMDLFGFKFKERFLYVLNKSFLKVKNLFK